MRKILRIQYSYGMAERYTTIPAEGAGEIEEKKSRFIATLRPVRTQEEAAAFYAEMKKKYWDARHNCTACILGKKGEFRHSSDDGEPSGTAGRPMLEALQGAGVTDVAAVVTRYFGGTLLGTGGLVRAYTAAVQEGLKNCGRVTRTLCVRLRIMTDYNGLGKLQYLFAQKGIGILDAEYGENVRLETAVPPEEVGALTAAAADATAGKAVVEELDPEWIETVS